MPVQLSDFETYDPSLIYKAYRPQTQNQNALGWFDNNYNKTYNWDYMGEQANMIRQGQDPTGSFTDYMKNKNPMREFMNLAPTQRGVYRGRYAPPTTGLGNYWANTI